MNKHETKYCPRCRNSFECRAGSVTQCQCGSIQLSVEERAYIELKHEDCLCIHCLEALQQEYLIFKEKHIYW